MTYHVVEVSGKQYKVSAGDTILVDRLDAKEGEKLVLDQVLLNVENDKVSIGTPVLKGTSISATVIKHVRGKKIRVATYKSKSRYRRVKGHKSHLTKLEISAIKKSSSPRKSSTSKK